MTSPSLGWALSPLGLVSWTPYCLGIGWPEVHLAFGDDLPLGKSPKAFYWRTNIFARLADLPALLRVLSPSPSSLEEGPIG